MQAFKEGNVCWNCRYINTCRPLNRPESECNRFQPLGRVINQEHVAELLGVSLRSFSRILSLYGADKVIEMLSENGFSFRYELVSDHIRFYKIEQKRRM